MQLYFNGDQFNCFILTAMLIIANVNPSENYNYSAAAASVTTLYRAQVSILASSNAHESLEISFQMVFDFSLHLELQLLMKAELSALNAIRTATVLPIKHYELKNRKNVKMRKKADLILVGCDPIMNVSCSKDIRAI